MVVFSFFLWAFKNIFNLQDFFLVLGLLCLFFPIVLSVFYFCNLFGFFFLFLVVLGFLLLSGWGFLCCFFLLVCIFL